MIDSPVLPAAPEAALASLEQALQQIKEANFYLRTSLDQVGEGVMIVETTATDPKIGPPVIYGNSQAVMMSRAKPETGLRGMCLAEMAASEADAAKIMACLGKAIANAGATNCETSLQ